MEARLEEGRKLATIGSIAALRAENEANIVDWSRSPTLNGNDPDYVFNRTYNDPTIGSVSNQETLTPEILKKFIETYNENASLFDSKDEGKIKEVLRDAFAGTEWEGQEDLIRVLFKAKDYLITLSDSVIANTKAIEIQSQDLVSSALNKANNKQYN
jgi:hypothetical protein